MGQPNTITVITPTPEQIQKMFASTPNEKEVEELQNRYPLTVEIEVDPHKKIYDETYRDRDVFYNRWYLLLMGVSRALRNESVSDPDFEKYKDILFGWVKNDPCGKEIIITQQDGYRLSAEEVAILGVGLGVLASTIIELGTRGERLGFIARAKKL